MLFIIWAILIILGILFPKSKMVSLMIMGFMIVSIAFRTQGTDYIIYQNEYQWSEFQVFSDVHYVGFLIIEQWAHQLGVSFEQFKVAIGVLSCGLLYFGLQKLTLNINIVLALYLIYPYSHDAVQARTFMANSVIVAALPLVLKEPVMSRSKNIKPLNSKVIRIILFYIIAVIGCSFHFEAAIYVFFITLMLFLPEKYSKEYIIIGAVGAFILIETGILPKLVSSFNSRISYWLSGRTGLGIVIPITITLVIWYTMQLAGKNCVKKCFNRQEETLYKKMVRFSDFSFLLIPLFCYDITFNRLWRIFLLILYIMVAKLIPYKISKNLRLWIIFLLSILFISICIYEGVFRILNSFFQNNAILGIWSAF